MENGGKNKSVAFIILVSVCININFEKFTLMTGFVVQGHK